MSNFCEIEKLVELFNPTRDEHSDSENEEEAVTDVQQPKDGANTETSKAITVQELSLNPEVTNFGHELSKFLSEYIYSLNQVKNKVSAVKKNPYTKIEKATKEEAAARILTDPYDEKLFFDEEQIDGSSGDWRKCPKWDISYRQKVTASDVYLQMGNKSPATASCENMIISVHLPGEDRQNIDLKVTKERLDVVSSSFRLGLPLPHPVDPQRGNAQWDKDAEKLIITLDMDREFDYINF